MVSYDCDEIVNFVSLQSTMESGYIGVYVCPQCDDVMCGRGTYVTSESTVLYSLKSGEHPRGWCDFLSGSIHSLCAYCKGSVWITLLNGSPRPLVKE
jgi:hypothetical protein